MTMRRLVNQRKSIHQLGPAAVAGAARSSFQFVDVSQRRFLERWSPSLLPSATSATFMTPLDRALHIPRLTTDRDARSRQFHHRSISNTFGVKFAKRN